MSETQVFIKNDAQGESFRRIEYNSSTSTIKIFRVKVEAPIDILDIGKEEEIERDERMEAPFTVSELCDLGWADPEEWGFGDILSKDDIIHVGVRLDTAEAYYRMEDGYAWGVLGPAEALHLICSGDSDLAVVQNT